MTHGELCLLGERFLHRNGFKVSFHDRFVASVRSGEQPDALGFRNGASCLLEAKCSRSDFLADKKKKFRVDPSMGMGDWRFFICPAGLISEDELPSGWGLLEVKGTRVFKVCGWPGNCGWTVNKPFSADKQAECDYMYSALRRVQLRGHLNDVYDKL